LAQFEQRANIKFCFKLGKTAVEVFIHWELVPNRQTVNSIFYIEVLKRLKSSIRRKRLDKWENGWFLHHGKAPCPVVNSPGMFNMYRMPRNKNVINCNTKIIL
jgi:hypothetical protein